MVFSLTIALLLGVSSCDSDDPAPSQKELTVEALDGNWTVNETNSVNGTGVDINGSTATFTESGFTFSGAVTSFASGGTYIINEDGSFENVQVNLVSSDVTLDGEPQMSMNAGMDTITITFNVTESGGRLSGLGSWSLVFNKQ